MTNAETQLATFFAKYEPAIAKLGKALRAKLRARLPGLNEIVYFYENQESLVISYSCTEQGYAALCTLSLSPQGAKLYFANAAALSKLDPNKLLQGGAKTVRYVALSSVAEFERAEIEALMAAALKLAKLKLVAGAEGAVILKAGEQKQRALQAKKAAKPASAVRKPKARRRAAQK